MNNRLRATVITALIVIGCVAPAVAQPINEVSYLSIGPNIVDFNDVPGAPFPPPSRLSFLMRSWSPVVPASPSAS